MFVLWKFVAYKIDAVLTMPILIECDGVTTASGAVLLEFSPGNRLTNDSTDYDNSLNLGVMCLIRSSQPPWVSNCYGEDTTVMLRCIFNDFFFFLINHMTFFFVFRRFRDSAPRNYSYILSDDSLVRVAIFWLIADGIIRYDANRIRFATFLKKFSATRSFCSIRRKIE